MSTKNISGGKGGRCVRVTTSPPLSAECHEKSRSLNFLESSGPHRACYRTALPVYQYSRPEEGSEFFEIQLVSQRKRSFCLRAVLPLQDMGTLCASTVLRFHSFRRVGLRCVTYDLLTKFVTRTS